MKKADTKKKESASNTADLTGIIEKIVKRTMRMDLTWDWPCGVAYYGITKAYEATQNMDIMDMLKARVDELIELGLPKVWTVNGCAMGHTVLSLYEVYGDQSYLDIAMSKLDYLRHKALRFADNVLQHTVSPNDDFPEQAWADTLFMAAYFMLRMGKLLEDEDLKNDALNQYYWHIKYLQDPNKGLWYHGYEHINKTHMSGFFWGRANAWAAYTMSRVGNTLPAPYLYPRFMDVAGSINEQLGELKLLQTKDGLWRTILDDETAYEEVSASCGIAAAMTVRGNPLHRKYVVAALNGVLKNIAEDGRVLNVSGGTAIMRDRDGYQNISRDWIQGWGQGLALAFLSAYLHADKHRSDGAL